MKSLRLTSTLLAMGLLTGCAAGAPEPVVEASTSQTEVTAEATESAVPTEETAAPSPDETTTTEPKEDEQELAQDPESVESTAKPSAKPTATVTPKPTLTATQTPSPTPTETAKAGYTKAEVAQKNSRTSCWAIVSGSVYNLTDWIARHPGGAGAISSLCGTDATAAFEGQHGGEARPSSTLESYYLGPLID